VSLQRSLSRREDRSGESCRLWDGGKIVPAAVEVSHQGHEDSDHRGQALDVLANLDLGAPELLAGDERSLVRAGGFAGAGLWLSGVLQRWLPDQQACSGEAQGGR